MHFDQASFLFSSWRKEFLHVWEIKHSLLSSSHTLMLCQESCTPCPALLPSLKPIAAQEPGQQGAVTARRRQSWGGWSSVGIAGWLPSPQLLPPLCLQELSWCCREWCVVALLSQTPTCKGGCLVAGFGPEGQRLSILEMGVSFILQKCLHNY